MVLQNFLNHVFAKTKLYFLTQLFSFFFLCQAGSLHLLMTLNHSLQLMLF